jgi:hypothetical protein
MRAARLHRLLLVIVVVDERKERWCGAKAKALHLPVLWTRRRQVSSSTTTCKDDDDNNANIMVMDD